MLSSLMMSPPDSQSMCLYVRVRVCMCVVSACTCACVCLCERLHFVRRAVFSVKVVTVLKEERKETVMLQKGLED